MKFILLQDRMDSALKNYLPFKYQEVKFANSKKKRASYILSTEVDIKPSEHDDESIPSEISVENISDGNWKDILFPGKAMDVYYENSYMAYTKDVIKLGVPESRVIVRRLETGEDFEIQKHYAGCKIQDLAFSYTLYPILLACVYDNACVDIHRVVETYDSENETVDFSVEPVFLPIVMDIDYDKQINFRKIFWCPHEMGDDHEDEDEDSNNGTINTPAGIFALYSGNKVDVYYISLIRKHCAAVVEVSRETIAETKASVTLSKKKVDHDLITDLRVSPDGKQLACVANDGYMRIYDLSFDNKSGSLKMQRFHRLYPSGTILSFIFLDENRSRKSISWDMALTFAHNLNEAKIWRYEDSEWNSLQTVRVNPSNIVIDEFYCGYKFYTESQNRYVLLLDTRRNAVYVFIFQKVHKMLVVDCVMEFVTPKKISAIFIADTIVEDIDTSDSANVKNIIEQYGNFFFEDRIISLLVDAYVVEEKSIERVAMKGLLPPLPKDDFSRENLVQLVIAQDGDELDGISEQLENLESCVENYESEAPVLEEFSETLGNALAELELKVEEDRVNFPDVLNSKLQESIGEYLEKDENDLQVYIQNYAENPENLKQKDTKTSTKLRKNKFQRKKAFAKFLDNASSESSLSSDENSAEVGDANAPKTSKQVFNEITVARLIVKGQYDEAFIFALETKDIELINLACNEVDFEDIFDDEEHAIDNQTLCGLILIICDHLTTDTLIEKTVKFLHDAIYYGRVNKMIEENDFLKIYAKLRKILLETTFPDLIIFCHQLMRFFPLTKKKSAELVDAKKADDANDRLLKVLRKNDLQALRKFLRKDNMECIFKRDALSPDVVYILALRLADILPYDERVVNCYLPGVIRLWQRDKLCKSKFPKLWSNVSEKLNVFADSDDEELSENAEILLSISTY